MSDHLNEINGCRKGAVIINWYQWCAIPIPELELESEFQGFSGPMELESELNWKLNDKMELESEWNGNPMELESVNSSPF